MRCTPLMLVLISSCVFFCTSCGGGGDDQDSNTVSQEEYLDSIYGGYIQNDDLNYVFIGTIPEQSKRGETIPIEIDKNGIFTIAEIDTNNWRFRFRLNKESDFGPWVELTPKLRLDSGDEVIPTIDIGSLSIHDRVYEIGFYAYFEGIGYHDFNLVLGQPTQEKMVCSIIDGRKNITWDDDPPPYFPFDAGIGLHSSIHIEDYPPDRNVVVNDLLYTAIDLPSGFAELEVTNNYTLYTNKGLQLDVRLSTENPVNAEYNQNNIKIWAESEELLEDFETTYTLSPCADCIGNN